MQQIEKVTAPAFKFRVECHDKDGNFKWAQESKNLVTTQGKNDLVDKYFKGSAYTAAFFLGLKGSGAISAADTLSSHAAWSEVTAYAGNRPTMAFNTTSGGSNTATAIAITFNAPYTVAGAFIATVAIGTAGVLYSASDFATPRSGASGDVLTVTATVAIT